uniref:Uncharacterized protein n=1 Tax=Gopherus evgoodei TaxID=1825980 RepID=A0A8C4YKT6_9SAUR
FECRKVLPHKLEWKIIYMASAESEKYDQVQMFGFEAKAPSPSHLPKSDVVWMTVELILMGYSINNELWEYLRAGPEFWEYWSLKPDFSQLHRNILSSNPHSGYTCRRRAL